MTNLSSNDVVFNLAVPSAFADGGYSTLDGTTVFWRAVLVEPDGTVRTLDPVGGHYSRHHQLPAAHVADAQRLAALVRSGSHYVSAGTVYAAKGSVETKEPVQGDGWYELRDGRVGWFSWREGAVRCREIVATWAETTSASERAVQNWRAEQLATRRGAL